MKRWIARVCNFAIRRRDEDRVWEEIESHLDLLTEEHMRAGMSRAEARRAARMKFGAVEAVREDCVAERTFPSLEELLQDGRYAIRLLCKSPGFAMAALMTLALSIGTNVVVLAVLNAVLLRPIDDVFEAQDLYQLRLGTPSSGALLTTSFPAFEDLARRNSTFSGLAAKYGYADAMLMWTGGTRKVRGYEVSANYFDLLGTKPQVGRFFTAEDDRGPGSAPYVVLSDHLWRSAFRAEEGVVGRTVNLNGQPFMVVAVASARFHGTERFEWPDYWMPIANGSQAGRVGHLRSRTRNAVTVLGRLKAGVTPEQATENLNAIVRQLADEHPDTDKDESIRLIRPGLFGDDREGIGGFLYAIVALALLLLGAACANLASLFAARAADRRRELALRVALGAGRLRVARQLLTESGVVALLGGAAGLGCAHVLLDALNHWQPAFGYGGQRLGVSVEADVRIYLAAVLLSLASACMFGILPARRAWRSRPLSLLKGGGPMDTEQASGRFSLQDLLLGAQIACCTLLVTASFVAVGGVVRVLQGPLGIQPRGALLAELDIGQSAGRVGGITGKAEAMIEAVRSLPGVLAAGAARHLPLAGGPRAVPVHRPDAPDLTPRHEALSTRLYSVSPGYLDAAGTRLVGGRDFIWQHNVNTPQQAIVNATFARRMWIDSPAIGQRFLLAGRLTEVVGVVEDGKYHNLMEDPQPVVFVPLQEGASALVFVVRSRLAPTEMEEALQKTLNGFVPDVSVTVRTWPDALASVLFPGRAAAVVLGVMGVLAVMLAVTGISGMAAYNVSRRMRELGIRAALGANRVDVLRAAVGRPVLLLLVGSAVGLLAGVMASRALGAIVYQATPGSPAVLAGVILTMVIVGVAGAAVPARRALGVQPFRLMREE